MSQQFVGAAFSVARVKLLTLGLCLYALLGWVCVMLFERQRWMR